VASILDRERFHERDETAETANGGEVTHMSVKAKLVLGWTLVGVPLLYGIWQTLVKTAGLFSG